MKFIGKHRGESPRKVVNQCESSGLASARLGGLMVKMGEAGAFQFQSKLAGSGNAYRALCVIAPSTKLNLKRRNFSVGIPLYASLPWRIQFSQLSEVTSRLTAKLLGLLYPQYPNQPPKCF